MSAYRFNINKRHIVAATDSSNMAVGMAETFEDPTKEADAQRDIDVSIYLDDVLKDTVTLTDAGATLQFGANISAGEHTIRITAPKHSIQSTDICVDQFFIGKDLCVASQWDFNNQVFGTTSTLRQKCAPHNAQGHDYVWWGRVVHNDSSRDVSGLFYRPCIVSEHRAEWHMDFTRTADGKIWISQPFKTYHMLWDSTAQHVYYFVSQQDLQNEYFVGQYSTNQATVDAAYDAYQDEYIWDYVFADSSTMHCHTASDAAMENCTRRAAHEQSFEGFGTYQFDSNNHLNFVSASIDKSAEDANNIVCLTFSEHAEVLKQHWYHRNYTVTPITVT